MALGSIERICAYHLQLGMFLDLPCTWESSNHCHNQYEPCSQDGEELGNELCSQVGEELGSEPCFQTREELGNEPCSQAGLGTSIVP